MAKRKPSLPEQAAEVDIEHIRQARRLEASLAATKAALVAERKKRSMAEQELAEAAEREAVLLATAGRARPRKVKISKTSRKAIGTAVICCNDWHAEQTIDACTVNGLNEFNADVRRRRLGRLWQKSLFLLQFARNVTQIREVVLWLGGDLISGTIHEELEEGNSLGPAESILLVEQEVVTGIKCLLEHADIDLLRVVTNHGNHGRTTKRKRIATSHKHSWEWLAYSQLAREYVEDRRVSFEVATGYHNIVDIQGSRVRFHHGDGVRYQGGVGGISIPVNKAIGQWNKSTKCDYDVFAHWHQYLDHWNWTSSGCLVGYDPFALSIKAEFQEPTQTFLVFDSERRKVMSLPIFVG